jgi:5'(3')-deoxyribonucleotidase
MINQDGGGIRENQGKTRMDLIPAFAHEQMARVLTFGANKYEERNWERGMAWSKILASLERHLYAVKRGEDFDPETGLLHSAHVMTNAAFLTEFYKIYPEGDDRPLHKLSHKRIALDIDEVLADFVSSFMQRFKIKERPEFWHFTQEGWLESLVDDDQFWLNLSVKTFPEDIPFEPHCYISSRITSAEVTREWLNRHGFPTVPLYLLKRGESKVEAFKMSGAEVMVDDRYENFLELTKAGHLCYLFDQPHNRKYNVGHKRIYSLRELVDRTF